MANSYRRIVLASRPHGWCSAENFRLEEAAMPAARRRRSARAQSVLYRWIPTCADA